ncbi:hypothetical protein OIDMADRAFT_202060 [Oidiodendron maius Zn]|uniref:Uncharacterized protein n=1 Tax=Oidiodendron maius (strain Zn) TaxID=913774 RepID=A0A0C3H750_OIDMZ|nr:hypothetical protein OIDMADRAFT_202060 [Oidiodendron maius Zn]
MAQSIQLKKFYTSANPFEKNYGYYRAVRHGNYVFVSGTTATTFEPLPEATNTPVPKVLFPGDARQQASFAMNEGIEAIKGLGGKGIADVVRVRMFVCSREHAAGVGEAFTNMFGQADDPAVGVAATMVIAHLVNEEMLVEIEMDAVLSSSAE